MTTPTQKPSRPMFAVVAAWSQLRDTAYILRSAAPLYRPGMRARMIAAAAQCGRAARLLAQREYCLDEALAILDAVRPLIEMIERHAPPTPRK